MRFLNTKTHKTKYEVFIYLLLIGGIVAEKFPHSSQSSYHIDYHIY